MSTLRQAAQQALEALRCVDLQSLVPDYGSGHYSVARLDGPQVKSAITAMEAALAEPVFNFKEPQPGMVNLDAFRAFHFNDPPKGGFVGEIEMLKWLVRNRDGDYWKAKYGAQEPVAFAHINGTSDTKWHPPQRKPLSKEEIKECERQAMVNGSLPFEQRVFFARAIERAHGIT